MPAIRGERRQEEKFREKVFEEKITEEDTISNRCIYDSFKSLVAFGNIA